MQPVASTVSIILASLVLVEVGHAQRPQPVSLSEHFGFLPQEIYKLDFRIQNLLVRDVDGDGKLDVIVVNNGKNRLDLLMQRAPNDPPTRDFDEVNDLRNDLRLKLRKVQMARPVEALEVIDLNKDNRADLVYLGEPPGLYIEYQSQDGEFSRKVSFENGDARGTMWALDIADLNQDGRLDIAYLGKKNLHIHYQREDGRFEGAKSFGLSASDAGLLRILDINGDGQNDIIYTSQESDFPLRVRFANRDAKLGPERQLKVDKMRGVTYANMDGNPGEELVTISDLSGRLLVYSLQTAARDAGPELSQPVVFPFEKGGAGASDSGFTLADMDGDGRIDFISTDPESAKCTLYRQTDPEGLNLGESFPTFLGAKTLRAADLDGDKKAELITLSVREQTLGIARFEENRLTFPQSIPTQDEPIVFDLQSNGNAHRLLYVARKKDSKTGLETFTLRGLDATIDANKKIVFNPCASAKDLADGKKIELNGSPSDLQSIDVNGDGKLDLVFFFVYQAPIVWLADGETFIAAPDSSRGGLGQVVPGAVRSVVLDKEKRTFLVGQRNFIRAVRLENGRWTVEDQINVATAADTNVTALTAIDIDGDKKNELAVYDRKTQTIILLRREESLYRRFAEKKVGPFNAQTLQLRSGDFNRDGRDDLMLVDNDKMAIAYTGISELEWKVVASYETDLRNGKLYDMTVGDVNNDSRQDIVAIEPAEHHIEILAYTEKPTSQIKLATRWKVFEEKTFRRGFAGGAFEPREVVIGDVDGDGRQDICMLVHDRLLVYRQDSGEPTPPAAKDSTAGSTISTP